MFGTQLEDKEEDWSALTMGPQDRMGTQLLFTGQIPCGPRAVL